MRQDALEAQIKPLSNMSTSDWSNVVCFGPLMVKLIGFCFVHWTFERRWLWMGRGPLSTDAIGWICALRLMRMEFPRIDNGLACGIQRSQTCYYLSTSWLLDIAGRWYDNTDRRTPPTSNNHHIGLRDICMSYGLHKGCLRDTIYL